MLKTTISLSHRYIITIRVYLPTMPMNLNIKYLQRPHIRRTGNKIWNNPSLWAGRPGARAHGRGCRTAPPPALIAPICGTRTHTHTHRVHAQQILAYQDSFIQIIDVSFLFWKLFKGLYLILEFAIDGKIKYIFF